MSRVDKNNIDDYTPEATIQSRVSRNSRLYQEVFDENDELENLPLDDNSRDIDINKLKEIISDVDNNKTDISRDYDDSFWENKKRNIDDNKIYDINKLLEKAKYENGKLKESESDLLKTSRQILSKLDIEDDYNIDDDKISNSKSNDSNNDDLEKNV